MEPRRRPSLSRERRRVAGCLGDGQSSHRSAELHLLTYDHRLALQEVLARHSAALGDEEVADTKKVLGFDPDKTFEVADEVIEHTRRLVDRGFEAEQEWQQAYDSWAADNPEGKTLQERLAKNDLSLAGRMHRRAGLPIPRELPRSFGGKCLLHRNTANCGVVQDLAESNLTTPEGEPSFLPSDRDPVALMRVLHFGIREHAMGAIMNGIKLHGGLRPYGDPSWCSVTTCGPRVWLAALMKLPVTYVWTHDSIGLGEYGPTHQPIEHLAALRAIPGLDVVRPVSANETAAAWESDLDEQRPAAASTLTRQAVPIFPRGKDGFADISEVAKGGYILKDKRQHPGCDLSGTGSEVQYIVTAQQQLADQGIGARVVSMPCREWFDGQDQDYRDSVIPPDIKARVTDEVTPTDADSGLDRDSRLDLGRDDGVPVVLVLLVEPFPTWHGHDPRVDVPARRAAPGPRRRTAPPSRSRSRSHPGFRRSL